MDVDPPVPPIRFVVRDDLRRNRLTVFFRLLLALPHLVWLVVWGIGAAFASFVLWLAVLLKARAPEGLHNFLVAFQRYSLHVTAYVLLVANPFPGFRGRPGYPVDLEVAPPQQQNRWAAGARFLLALPAILLAAALGSWLTWSIAGFGYLLFVAALFGGGAAPVLAVLIWFAAVVTGRAPQGLRDLAAYSLGHGAWTGAYSLLLTDRYPSSDPQVAEEYAELPKHPVRIAVFDDLSRPRLTVFFRLLLAMPHFVWLWLWAVAAFLALIAAWLVALVRGRVPTRLHRFLAAYVRCTTHVFAFVYLVGRKFPGFTGREGSYEIDALIAPPEAQRRATTLFRGLLAMPALAVAGMLGLVLFVVAFLGWWFALVRGRMPEGLRNLGAACLRYGAQTSAYFFLVTDRYPFASPLLRARAEVAVEEAPE